MNKRIKYWIEDLKDMPARNWFALAVVLSMLYIMFFKD